MKRNRGLDTWLWDLDKPEFWTNINKLHKNSVFEVITYFSF